MDILRSKGFLTVGGWILVVVGILGMVNVLGPTESASIFGSAWWFDGAENWAHLVLGVVALWGAYKLSASSQKNLAGIFGVVALLVGIYSLLGNSLLLGANLENPADTILHIVVGIWGLLAAKNG